MEIIDIITADAERDGVMPGAVVTGLSIAIDKRGAKLFHDNKTVAVIEPIKDSKGSFEIHLFTADNPSGLLQSCRVLFQEISALPGMQKLYSTFEDPKIKKLLEMIGVDLKKSDKKGFTWMTEV